MFGAAGGSPDAVSTRSGDTENAANRPLAVRMRPRTLDEIIGQERILGPECLLPGLIRSNRFGSLIFYGPPGCGKTTLAEVIAEETGSRFVRLNAVLSNVAELREILRFTRSRPEDRTVLFIDEIHRFNRAQQDLLLPDVEAGNLRLIGATTHNPGFSVIAPLLSRSHLFRLEPLDQGDIASVLKEALSDRERGLGGFKCTADEAVMEALAGFSEGDLRRALSALETLVASVSPGSRLTREEVIRFAGERQIRYDANEDEHYDTASAFIKSMRGGDPDAALYWLAKMLEGGEQPRFIARRLVILASEDVGLADPGALPLAVAAFQACELIGLPECELNLAHAVVYLATAPKSNSAYEGLKSARRAIKEGPVQQVPLHLRDASTKTNKSFGHGADYRYSHNYPEGISGQDFMETPQKFYHPRNSGAEKAIAERLQRWRSIRKTEGN
jgi:putative ATPase